jgi:hypothetical protein
MPYQQSIFVVKDYDHKLESGCKKEELLVESKRSHTVTFLNICTKEERKEL